MPTADVLVHCGDFTDMGTEEEVLLNWFISLPYPHKLFVVGNHDLCLWEADGIEDLPDNVHFLQDRVCEINGVKFFGLGYNHPESLIPDGIDVLVTHEPPIMILDEATSSIDTRTEALIQKGMDRLMEGRTVFVIAHRLSTIMNSDVIMVLDHGKIIERGTHESLIAKKGRYYQLYTGSLDF